MATKTLRWGMLSTARINRALIHPLRVSERNQLHAIASRSLDKAQHYAQKWHIPIAYGNYQELLDDPEIDVIYNPLPNNMHAEWTIKAVQAGKHVLCEKPITLTVEELDAIQNAAQSAGMIVTEAFMYRHHPQTLQVKALVDEGAIGELMLIRGSFSFYLDREDDIRLLPEMGGGSMWDVGCYPISYARYIAGEEPEEVFGWQVSNELGVDLTFCGQMRFPSGVMAQFDSSFRSPQRTHIEIVGNRGSIVVPRPFNPYHDTSIIINHDEETKTIHVPGELLYLGEVEDIADAILLDKPPRISLEDSRGNMQTIRKLLESARSGKVVEVR